MRRLVIYGLSLLIASSLWAEEIQLIVPSKDEINLKQAIKGLLEEDKKLAEAIYEASIVAKEFGIDQKIAFPLVSLYRFIKVARWCYERHQYLDGTILRKDISFIEYLEKAINKKYANCFGWVKYYKPFLENEKGGKNERDN